MQILSVALKNFKCHDDRYFEFQPGFNAICGENGAGKSSILDAIAWALFDYTDYTREELVRRGAKTAQVAVQFISSADGRTYRVERSTSSGYRIIDPQIKQALELARINEEVVPWLKANLGLPSNANLPRLFSELIGIPQGTLTVDFLKTARDRRLVFNPILKVEDYEQAFKAAQSLEKFAAAQVKELTQTIAHYHDRLQDWPDLKQAKTQVEQEISQDQAALADYANQLASLSQEKAALDAIAANINRLEQESHALAAQKTAQEQTIAVLKKTVATAQTATEICAANQAHHQAYQVAEEALKQLNRQSQARQALLTQREAAQAKLKAGQQSLTRLEVQLEALNQAAIDLERLKPLVAQQADLDRQQQALTSQFQQIEAGKREHKTLERQQAQGRKRLAQLDQDISRIQTWQGEIASVATVEQQRDRLQQQLSRIAAARQFEADLQQLVQRATTNRDRHTSAVETALTTLHDLQASVPLYSERIATTIATLQSGQTLTQELIQSLETILADLSPQVDEAELHQQLQHLGQRLTTTYQRQAEWATLPSKQAQQAEWQTEQQQIQAQLDALTAQLANEPTLQQQQATLTEQLQTLDNPRGRSQLLTKQLRQRESLQTQLTEGQQAQATLQADYDRATAQLQAFASLDADLEEQTALLAHYQPGHTAYIQHQKQAAQLAPAEQELQAATSQYQTLQSQHSKVQQTLAELAPTFDRPRLATLEASITQTLAHKNQLEGRLPVTQQHLAEIDRQLADRTTIAEQRDQAQQALATQQQTSQFISDARQIYKQAGPRITRFYLGEISREADRLFRELLNRQNLALDWTEDYEIRVQEAGYWRSFKALSGGEQMCAALAVRLALLKVLADSDVAFFDEPTTNMDAQRRQQLAEALSNLRSFRQLFVISHDDTFENLTENVVRVDRQPAL